MEIETLREVNLGYVPIVLREIPSRRIMTKKPRQLHLILQNGKLSPSPLNGPLHKIFLTLINTLSSTILFTMGDGSTIPFWHFNWGFGILKFKFQTLYSFSLDPHVTVHYFLQNLHNLHALFKPALSLSNSASNQLSQILACLQNTNLPSLPTLDNAIWKLNSSQSFSTKSYYLFIKTLPKHNSNLKTIWKLKIPPRMKIFLWRLLQNGIATIDNLRKRGWVIPNFCYLCKSHGESVQHLFNDCSFTTEAKLALLSTHCPLDRIAATRNTITFLSEPVTTYQTKAKEMLGIFCFIIWRERCKRLFTEEHHDVNSLLEQVSSEWSLLNPN
ncbi:RNA-directed DNA polymerase (reverse transcriptase)-related family protein [Rhynchospora pubera]|uniref:RNA-directed DNA polymerase (Reverse transcriptase)-related family protein n=1 Tax=Rhynchospora pubera TaxID=906938 RepID=A0AAV8HRW6_9POAL|nr:RNA-directed DNA polymerase (reverse transcriptase)-related family protein [Rhynchospora pubera]